MFASKFVVIVDECLAKDASVKKVKEFILVQKILSLTLQINMCRKYYVGSRYVKKYVEIIEAM